MNEFFLNNNPDFYTEIAVLDIAKIVAWKKSKNAYNVIIFPKTAVISLAGNVLGTKQRLLSKKIKGLAGQNYIVGETIFCSGFGNGAPATISLMEELRVLGVQHFLFAGFAGTLTAETNDKKAYLVTKTFSTTGCSSFYAAGIEFALPKTQWSEKIKKSLGLPEAVCWSTDAPFRETRSLLSGFISKGATHVDMECAAIYAFAAFYKIDALCVLLPADSLFGNSWNPPNDMKNLNVVFRKTIFRLLTVSHGK